jgi:hypothetical protein
MAAPVAILIAAVVILGFWPGLIQGFLSPAANILISMFNSPLLAAGQ